MKNLKTTIITCFLLVSILTINSCTNDQGSTGECLPANLKNGAIAFYPFSGGSLADESVNSNTLYNTSAAASTSDRFGNPNCAFLFDNPEGNPYPGVQFLYTTSSSFLDNLDDFSISIWYQPLAVSPMRSAGSFEVLLGRGATGHCPDRTGEWSVGLFDCRRAVFGHDNSVWANMISNPIGCSEEIIDLTGNWHHVVATKNGTDFKIYFNGVLDDSASGIVDCSPYNYTAQDIGDLYIGSNYTGKVDDIIIYNRELSQTEVTQLYELDPCCQ